MRWIRRALSLAAALAIAWLGIVLSGVLPLISAEQRAALAFLRDMPPPPPGRNAFALLWARPYAVPEGQEEALLAEDVARFADYEARWQAYARASRTDDSLAPPDAFGSVARDRHPERARLPDGVEWLCDAQWGDDCLAAVARDPVAARAALAGVADLRALSRRIVEADVLRNPFPPSPVGPLPGYDGWARFVANDAALRAHDGDPAGALEDLCRFGNAWRRMRKGTDTLVADMIGISYATVAVQQALAIHAAAPAGTAWPEACETLLAPLSAAERDQRGAARGEFAIVDRSFPAIGAWSLHPSLDGLGNAEHTLARMTAHYRPLCPAIPAPDAARCGRTEWAFNPIGCRFIDQASPMPGAVAEYAVRLDDFDRRLALARAARWWRAQPGAATGAAPAWPDAFAAIRDEITVDPTARTLVLPMRHARGDRSRARFAVRY